MIRRVPLALLLLAGCTLDTSLPETPMRGRLLGTVDTQGHLPAAGQTVSLSSDKGDHLTQLTDDTGAFVFADLPPGLYLVSVSLPGFARLSSDLLRVRSGQDTDAGTLAPDWLQNTPSEATLNGKVTAASGGDISGAVVEFVLAGTVVSRQTVGVDGLFVQKLPPGTFVVRASHPAFVTAMLTDVVLAAGEDKDLSATPLVLDINPATLQGIVFKDRDGQEPVAATGATVTLETGQSTVVDAAGNFRLTGLPGGAHQARVASMGFHDVLPTRPVLLSPGMTATLDKVTLLLDRGTIVGTVKLADNAPVSGARVEVAGTNYAAIVSPDAADPSKGGFSIGGVPAGVWSVTARKDQYSNATVTITLTADAPKDTGTLTLARLLGDFLIDDADATNTAGYTRTQAVTLNFTGFPPTGVASYRASEDAQFTGVMVSNYTGRQQPFTLQAGEGSHTVYAQYTDTNGQVSQTFSSNIVLDTIKPPVPIVTLQSTGQVGSTKYTNLAQNLPLAVQANDGAGSGLSLMRVGDALDAMNNVTHATEPYRLNAALTRTNVGDGNQAVYVQLIDQAGNVSAYGTDSIVVDTAPPTGNIALQRGAKATDNGYTNSPLATVSETYSDGAGGVVLVKLANSSGDVAAAVYQPASPTTGWFLNPSGDGLKTVYARFRDAAGNETSADATASITYDTTPPNPAAASLQTPAVTRNATVGLLLTTNPADLSTTQALTLSDESSFTSAAVVGPSAFPGTSTATFTLPPGDGVRSVFVRFRDKAGNDAVTSAQVTLDTVPPTGSFSMMGALADGTPSASFASAALATLTIVPGGAVDYVLGGSAMTSCPASGYTVFGSTVINGYTLPANGIVTLCLRDAAGNAQGPLQQSITLDGTAPTGCTLAAAGTMVDGLSAAPAGKTANRNVTVTVGTCATATEMVIAEGAVSCATAGLNWVPFNGSSVLNLGGPDGPRPITGCVRDQARNVATLPGTSITLDTVGPPAPTVLVDNGAAYINAAAVTARGGNIGSISGSANTAVDWALSEDPQALTTFAAVATRNFTFGGTGLRTIYARFRDDVGNLSSIASDTITIDVSAPSLTGVSFAFITPPLAQAGFTNNPVAQLSLSGTPPDAVGVQLVQTAGGSCPAALFTASVPVRSLQSVLGLNLSGPDGAKTICAQLLNAAGNGSGPLPAVNVTVDTVAPTAPNITTPPATYNISQAITAGLPAISITTFAGVTDLNFDHYERAGGTLGGWTTNGTTDAVRTTTTFPYGLQPDRANTLRLRAVDKAGNLSPEDTVVITWDNTRPTPPVLKNQWVDNGSTRSTVYWQASTSLDVTAYRVHYGPVPGNTSTTPPSGFNGATAVEGVSPLVLAATGAADQSLSLTGLTNSSVAYVTVTAVDAAGNESTAPVANPELGGSGYSRQVTAEPNVVSLNRVYRLPVTGAGYVDAVAIAGSRAYLAGHTNAGCTAGNPTLTAVDLSTLSSPISLGHIVASPAVPTITSGPTVIADSVGCTALATQATALVDLIVDGPWLLLGEGSKVRIYSLLNPGVPTLYDTVDVGVPNVQQLALIGDRLFVSADPSVVAVNLASLYDADATTKPSTSSPIIGTVTAPAGDVAGRWVSGMNVSRDRLVQYTHNGGDNLAYLLTSALAAVPTFTTAVSYIAITNDYLDGLTTRKQLTSGNYLYFSDDSSFSAYSLNRLWSSTIAGPGLNGAVDLVRQIQSPGGGGFDVQGSQAFVADRNGAALRSLDLSTIGAMNESSYTVGSNARAPIVFGNYLAVAGIDDLTLFETATPRSMHQVASAAGAAASQSNDVGPGFLFSGTGVTYDLHNSTALAPLSPSLVYPLGYNNWAYDMARFDDVVVSAQGQGFIVFDASKQTDRDGATTWTLADGPSTVFSVTTKRATGVEACGNFLVASEIRPDGVWLEVFDARRLRNRQAGAFDANTQSKASFRVANFVPSNSLWATLTVVDGRAIIGLDDQFPQTPPSPGLYVVDLRPLIDDTAGGAATVLASLPLTSVHETVVRGGWLYATTASGVSVVDIKEVMDEDGATVLPATPAQTDFNSVGPSDAIAVYGNYLYQVNRGGGAIRAIDVRQPLVPSVVSVLGIASAFYSGYATIEASYGPAVKPSRRALSVRGSRLYYTAQDEARIVELE